MAIDLGHLEDNWGFQTRGHGCWVGKSNRYPRQSFRAGGECPRRDGGRDGMWIVGARGTARPGHSLCTFHGPAWRG